MKWNPLARPRPRRPEPFDGRPTGLLAPWLLLITAAALALRLPALFANTWHSDEALFATWARLIAVWRDPWLLSQAVDKPPLAIYLQALFYPLMGPVPWAARLPGLAASILLAPLTAVLYRRLFGPGAGALWAALFVALSPLTVQFSATAFLDPLLALWLVLSLALAGRHPARSGLMLGLALLTKLQAALFWPLFLLPACRPRRWRRWLGGLLPAVAVLLLWAVARPDAPPLWQAQLSNYGGVRPAFSWELWPRLGAWSELWQIMLGGRTMLLLAVAAATVVTGRRPPKSLSADGLLLFLVAYGAGHWLLAIPVWDRYLLPLVPLVACLVGETLARGAAVMVRLAARRPVPRRLAWESHAAAAGLLLLLLGSAAWQARQGAFPVGGRPQNDAGAAQAAALLVDAPPGSVLYDHWYSWQWRYYLFDRPVYVSWMPDPAALARDLTVFGSGTETRYLALPAGETGRPFQRAVAAAGYRLDPLTPLQDERLDLFQIRPAGPPAPGSPEPEDDLKRGAGPEAN